MYCLYVHLDLCCMHKQAVLPYLCCQELFMPTLRASRRCTLYVQSASSALWGFVYIVLHAALMATRNHAAKCQVPPLFLPILCTPILIIWVICCVWQWRCGDWHALKVSHCGASLVELRSCGLPGSTVAMSGPWQLQTVIISLLLSRAEDYM